MAKLTGTNPDQVPTNADLGTMAYQDKDNVNVGSFTSNGIDDNATSTAMTLDSSGNLLVGKTSTGSNTVGSEIRDGTSGYTATFTGNDAANSVLSVMRNNGDGELIRLRNSSGNPVGTISTYSDGIVVGNSRSSSYANLRYTNDQVFPCTSTGGTNDNAIDLGKSTSRFQDLYLSGGVFLGGTGSSNKLNDYEEGTWTPYWSASGATPTLTYSTQIGRYTKIGDLVVCWARLTHSSISGGTGYARLSGLPFNPSSFEEQAGGQIGYSTAFDAGSTPIAIHADNGVNYCWLYYQSTAAGDINSTPNISSLKSTGSIYFSVVYKVA